jgi:chitinase
VWEEYNMAPYMFRGERWVSYDDERSLEVKAGFAFDQGLAGVMVWSIDTDDFRGI